MSPEHLSAGIVTYNEAPNLARVLARLDWCGEVVVLDSGSTDGTLEIARRFPNVRIEHRAFDCQSNQRNHLRGLIRTPWMLSLDADYVLSAALRDELLALNDTPSEAAFMVGFRYLIAGHALRGSLYPDKAVVFDVNRARFVQDGHTERLQVDGPVGRLRGTIDHDDRKPLSRWLVSQDRYAREEAEKLLAAEWSSLRLPDRVRRLIVPAPLIVVPYTLLVRGVIFDGLYGWRYVLERLIAECLLALRLLEARLKPGDEPPDRG